MKSILSKVGEILLVIIVIPIGLFLAIALLPMIIWSVILDVLRKLFVRLRKDPAHRSPKRYHIYANDDYPKGRDELGEHFNKYIAIIKKDCDINTDIEVATEPVDEEGDGLEYSVTLTARVKARRGTAVLKMYAIGGSGADDIFTAVQYGDVPPYLEVTYTQADGLRTVFEVSGYDSFEFLVTSLNNGQRLSRAGQIWVEIESDLYVVNYDVKKSDRSDRIGVDYGYRRAFSDEKVREYFFDKKNKAEKGVNK